jgi:hypothetical protein
MRANYWQISKPLFLLGFRTGQKENAAKWANKWANGRQKGFMVEYAQSLIRID